MTLTRRQLHRAALALALAPWSLRAQSPARPDVPLKWPSDPFALGVASGMPRPDGFVLWTRLFTGFGAEWPASPRESLDVSYEIGSDEALRQPVRSGTVRTDGQRAFSVHVPVTGLPPGRDWWYRFRCGDAVSRIGHTRTAPAPDADVASLKFALASCQHWEHGHYAAHREIATQPLDLVVFVGDYLYEGNGTAADLPRHHNGPTPRTLAQYRDRHALYKTDPHLQAAHAAHPWLLMWDDHEVVNDYADDLDPYYTEPAAFLKRRAAGYRAYFEHMPVLPPAPPPDWASVPLHDRFAWGRLADLWTLDCRQYRSPHACNDPNRRGGHNVVAADCPELADPSRSMLGPAQERWLAEGLASSQRRWKLLAQTTQIAPSGLDGKGPNGQRTTYTEAWDGYPEARKRLLQTVVDTKQSNVVTLGGDVHHHAAAQLRLRPNDAASPVVASEFVTGAVTSRGLGPGTLAAMRASNPDLAHASGDGRGYALVEVTKAQATCTFRATPYPVTADAQLTTQARFAVSDGRAGVEKL